MSRDTTSFKSRVYEDQPLFNLVSLKKTMGKQLCFKCDRLTTEWSIIGVCHDVLCSECLDVARLDDNAIARSRCPICGMEFDRNEDVRTIAEIQKAYDEMEHFLWETMTLENEMFDLTIGNSSPGKVASNSNIETDSMDVELHSMNGMASEIETMPLEEKQNSQDAPKTDTEKHLETFEPDVTISNPAMTDNTEREPTSMSDEDDPSTTDTSSSSSSEFELDLTNIREGRYYVTEPLNIKNIKIFITYTNVEPEEDLDVLRGLVHSFDIYVSSSWSDRITHLVLKTTDDGSCLRTEKYLNALLSNCFIINFDWARDCLRTKTLLPEVDYMLRDSTGVSPSMVSWRVGRGIIDSPMDWTNRCALYFHSSIVTSDLYTNIMDWARKAGFVLINEMEEFNNNEFKMRIILADSSQLDYADNMLPTETQVLTWMYDYKAVTVFVDWFLECLFNYKFVEISPLFQVVKLDSNVSEYTDMDLGLFQFL